MYDSGLDVILQARVNSSRLPKKILQKIGTKTILEHIIDRLSMASMVKRIIVGSTISSRSMLKRIELKYLGVDNVFFYYGEEDDVLKRFYDICNVFGIDTHVIRATADNPLLSPQLIDIAVYVHTANNNDFTRFKYIPPGLGAEVLSVKALFEAYHRARYDYEREHVSPYIINNRDRFSITEIIVDMPSGFRNCRLTVDTREDLKLIRYIYRKLYKSDRLFDIDEIVRLYKKEPDIFNINLHIKQRSMYESGYNIYSEAVA